MQVGGRRPKRTMRLLRLGWMPIAALFYLTLPSPMVGQPDTVHVHVSSAVQV